VLEYKVSLVITLKTDTVCVTYSFFA